MNITGRIDVLTSLTLKNADVTATAPSASSYAINAANYSKTITVMGDSSLTLKGKGGGKAANLYPEPEYRAQQVLYPAYTTSVFLDATSPDGSNGAYAWTDPTTEPNWNDYQYISIRTQDENTPMGMVQFKLDYVTDCEYTYTVDGDKLTLVGGNGTVEPGKVYELTKQE